MLFVLLYGAAFALPLLIPIFAVQKWGWRGLLGWYALFAGFCLLCAWVAPRLVWAMTVPWMLGGPLFLMALLFGGRTAILALPQLVIGLVIVAIAIASGRWPRSEKA